MKTGVSPAGFIIPTSPAPGSAGVSDVSGVISYSILVPKITVGELGGGSLVGVSYKISLGTYATYSIVDANPNTYTVSWGTGTLISPTFAPVAGLSTYGTGPFAGSPVIQIASALPAQELKTPGGPYTTAQQVINSGSFNDTANSASYIGAGNVTFVFKSSTQSGTSGAATQTTPDVKQGAVVEVTYTLSDVPEASTYAAGAALMLGVGFVARRRMVKA